MKPYTTHRSLLLAPLVLAPLIPLHAEDRDPISRIRLEEPKEQKNRFSLGYSAMFNMNAAFTHLGPSPSASKTGPGPATGGGVNRDYDDGYNRVDINGNRDGLTWNWGYKNASQVPGNDTLLMHSTSVAPLKSKDVNDDPEHGAILTYQREFCRDERGCFRWGLEAAFGWNSIDINDSRPVGGRTKTITDAYSLGAIDPNVAPYWDPETQTGHRGTYDGPAGMGPLIEDTPTRTVSTDPSGAVISGRRSLEGDLFFLHLGPYMEFPIYEKLHGIISGGVAVGILDAEFKFSEHASFSSGTSTAARGRADRAEGLIGGYVSLTLNYAIDEHWGVFLGGQFQTLGEYTVKASGRKASLDLGATPFLNAGVSYTF